MILIAWTCYLFCISLYFLCQMIAVLHISIFFMSNDSCDMNLGNSQTILLYKPIIQTVERYAHWHYWVNLIFICIFHVMARLLPRKFWYWWRPLEDAIHLEDFFQESSSRGKDSPVSYVLTRRLQDVSKTSWSKRIYLLKSYVFKTFSRRFQDVFKKTLFFVQFGLKWSFWLTKVLETDFLQKSNTTGTDSSLLSKF